MLYGSGIGLELGLAAVATTALICDAVPLLSKVCVPDPSSEATTKHSEHKPLAMKCFGYEMVNRGAVT